MRKIRLAIITIIIVLMSSSCITQQAIGQYTLPVYNRTVAYVRNLIETYNALVKNSTYINRPDFDNVKANFSLYRNAGYSFKVVVAQSVPDTSAYVALIFIPIRADQPNVTMDYNDTMLSLFGGAFYIAGQNSILKNNVVQYGNIIVQVPFIFVILSTDISSANYLANAKNAALYIYQQDTKQIVSFVTTSYMTTSYMATSSYVTTATSSLHTTFSITISQSIIISERSSTVTSNPQIVPTTTVTVTKQVPITEYIRPTITMQTTTAQNMIVSTAIYLESSTRDSFSWLYDNPAVKTIDSIFGSLADFALFIIIIVALVMHKRLTTELKELIRWGSSQRDKPEEHKGEQ